MSMKDASIGRESTTKKVSTKLTVSFATSINYFCNALKIRPLKLNFPIVNGNNRVINQ